MGRRSQTPAEGSPRPDVRPWFCAPMESSAGQCAGAGHLPWEVANVTYSLQAV